MAIVWQSCGNRVAIVRPPFILVKVWICLFRGSPRPRRHGPPRGKRPARPRKLPMGRSPKSPNHPISAAGNPPLWGPRGLYTHFDYACLHCAQEPLVQKKRFPEGPYPTRILQQLLKVLFYLPPRPLTFNVEKCALVHAAAGPKKIINIEMGGMGGGYANLQHARLCSEPIMFPVIFRNMFPAIFLWPWTPKTSIIASVQVFHDRRCFGKCVCKTRFESAWCFVR